MQFNTCVVYGAYIAYAVLGLRNQGMRSTPPL